MTHITKEEGLKIARISHIGLQEAEIQPLIHQLEQVLSYAERVSQCGLKSEETHATKLINVMREDKAVSTDPSLLLKAAPAREGDYFVVQAILENK